MVRQKVKGILIDFDGVIAKNSFEVLADYCITFIKKKRNDVTEIPNAFIKNYLLYTTCFPFEPTMELLFHSLGLSNVELKELRQEIENRNDYNGKKIIIEPDFYSFIDFCNSNEIDCKIVSLASPKRLSQLKLGPEYIFPLNNNPKASKNTFNIIINKLHADPKKWFYIDDSPMALHCAKQIRLNTVLMKNRTFKKRDVEPFKSSIDFKINSFSEFIKFLKLWIKDQRG